MKRYLLAGLGIAIATVVFAQTVAPNLRVLTDANNYLIVSAEAQTLPLSNPTPFSQIRLVTDSSNRLLVVCPSCGSGSGDVTGAASSVVGGLTFYSSTSGKALGSDTSMFWNATNQQLNILGGIVNNNGPLLVTRRATGGSPILATAGSFYRNSQYSGGTPTVNDILNNEWLLQASDNLWYTVAGMGGMITNITTPAGGPVWHCKPAAALGVDNVVPCMFLSSEAKLRIGDNTVPSSILEIKDKSTNFVLSAPTLSQAEVFGLRNQLSSFTPGNPTGTVSATAVMMGSGATIIFTPKQTGRVQIVCSLIAQNSLITGGVTVTIYRGTGTAPVNGVAVTGTQTGGGKTFTATANNGQSNIVLQAVPSGLTINTQYWFDFAVLANTTGTATITSISCILTEI